MFCLAPVSTSHSKAGNRNLLYNPEPIFDILISFSYARACNKATVSSSNSEKFFFFFWFAFRGKNCCETELCVGPCRLGSPDSENGSRNAFLVAQFISTIWGSFCAFVLLRLPFSPERSVARQISVRDLKSIKIRRCEERRAEGATPKTVINI